MRFLLLFLAVTLALAPVFAQKVTAVNPSPFELAQAAEEAGEFPEALFQYRLASRTHWGHVAAREGVSRMEKKLSLPPTQSWLPAHLFAWILYMGVGFSLLAALAWSLRLFFPLSVAPAAWQLPLGLTMLCLMLLAYQISSRPEGAQALTRLELRSGPGNSFPQRGELPQGSLVQNKRMRAAWVWIEGGEQQGWVRESALRRLQP